MSITVNEDGSITVMAYTTTPGGYTFGTETTTRMVLIPGGIRVISTMPGIIRKSRTMKTVVEYSIEDLVTMAAWKLKNADEDTRRRIIQSLLDIPREAAIDWMEYFFQKWSIPQPS